MRGSREAANGRGARPLWDVRRISCLMVPEGWLRNWAALSERWGLWHGGPAKEAEEEDQWAVIGCTLHQSLITGRSLD